MKIVEKYVKFIIKLKKTLKNIENFETFRKWFQNLKKTYKIQIFVAKIVKKSTQIYCKK